MSKISMRGFGQIGELCGTLEERLNKKFGVLTICSLLESTRRSAGGSETAVLLFRNSGVMSRYAESFVVSLCSDGEGVIADVLTRSSELFSDGDKIALKAADVLRALGFEEYERGGWVLEADKRASEPEAYEQYGDYLSPATWKKAAAQAQEQAAATDSGAESAASEKPRTRRGRRSYDPEL